MTGLSLGDVIVGFTVPPDTNGLLLSLIRVLHSIFVCRIVLHLKRASVPVFTGLETDTHVHWRTTSISARQAPGIGPSSAILVEHEDTIEMRKRAKSDLFS
ncbi:hypothetical protein K439DRAFT_1634103 [Ramaria rubella]|nr:hypothetical protein K439DRAFT_1634103 [Ramaria rubella]